MCIYLRFHIFKLYNNLRNTKFLLLEKRMLFDASPSLTKLPPKFWKISDSHTAMLHHNANRYKTRSYLFS